jgi:NAD(P)H-dependent FMN reductase
MIYMDTLKVKVIIGSTRQGRFSDKPAAWIAGLAKQRQEFEVELLDLRDHPLPFYDDAMPPSMVKDGAYANPEVKKWAEKIGEADAFIIVTPEYNRGPAAVLKNALDSVSREWNNKPVAFVAHGSTLGVRAIEQLRMNAIELRMAPTRDIVALPGSWTFADGGTKDGAFAEHDAAGNTMLDTLTWWAQALKVARSQA